MATTYQVSCETARECALLDLLTASSQREHDFGPGGIMPMAVGENPYERGGVGGLSSSSLSRLLPRGDFTDDADSYADDATWVLMASFVILTMQSGFGLLEMGFASQGNEVNIMMKNVMDVVFGALAFWTLGYGLAFGEPSIPFMGLGHFAPDVGGRSEPPDEEGLLFSSYLFQFSFAATATTIVSGAAAMRIRFNVYCLYSFVSVVVYGFVAHWVWADDGWLMTRGFHDFAGGATVHLLGGVNSLVAIIMIGPRIGRFDGSRPSSAFTPVSPTSVLFGLFILWWGWVGFICGSTFGITGSKWVVASRAAVVTINATSGGGIAAYLLSLVQTGGRNVLPINMITGILGALVATTPSADVIHFFEGLIVGALGAVFAIGANSLISRRLRLDDPVGAVGVHAGAGIWGVFAVGLFSDGSLVGVDVRTGLFRGGGWNLLGVQCLGIVATAGWGALCSSAFFYVTGVAISGNPLDPRSGLRVSRRDELRGADKCEHGITESEHEVAKRRAAAARRRRRNKDGDNNGGNEPGNADNAATAGDLGDSSQPDSNVGQFRSSGRSSFAGPCLAVDPVGEDISEDEESYEQDEEYENEDDKEAPPSYQGRTFFFGAGLAGYSGGSVSTSIASLFASVRMSKMGRSTRTRSMASGEELNSSDTSPGQCEEEKDCFHTEIAQVVESKAPTGARDYPKSLRQIPESTFETIPESPEQESLSEGDE